MGLLEGAGQLEILQICEAVSDGEAASFSYGKLKCSTARYFSSGKLKNAESWQGIQPCPLYPNSGHSLPRPACPLYCAASVNHLISALLQEQGHV